MDLRFALEDESVVRSETEGDLLRLLVQPGFKFERFKRQEVLESFAQEASALLGREIRVQIAELREQARPQRSLDELKAFKDKHVLFCNFASTPYRELSPVEPHILLADFVKAFHPEVLPHYQPKYYKLMK